ncbi:MAG: magnesium Mg(2+) and cobalt Co(2+) transport protein CorA [Bacteroidetes bacterium]|nr:MAG: magnesium Mg(2+) and cobalt Co(2+) transport protein CorA [Bacteroidota bacterium]
MQNLSEKSGTPPGTLVYFGKDTKEKVSITLIQYDEQEYFERDFSDFDECMNHTDNGKVKWINVDGIHDTAIVESIGTRFNIHPLTLEDIVNTMQRAKVEDYDNYIACIMKMVYENPKIKKKLVSEQLVIILLNDNTLISFQEADGGDVFDQIRNRLRQGKGRIRKQKADYLAYTLMDSVVDSYFSVLEMIGDELEDIEDLLLKSPDNGVLRRLHQIKREVIYLRKSVWPMREMVNNIERSETRLFSESTGIYLRDVHDHTIRVIDTIETYRDLLAGMMDIYLSSISNRMNQVMKTLTIITTIFVPLTFIAGVYGMNFKHMPELETKAGYFVVWGIMIAIAAGLLIYFRKNKWLK